MSPDLKSEIQTKLNQIAETYSYGKATSYGEVRRLVSYYLNHRVREKYNFSTFDIKTTDNYSRGSTTFVVSITRIKPPEYNEFVFELYR